MLGTNEEPGPWYPMYSFTDTLTADTKVGQVKIQTDMIKHQYLPQVIMAEDFDTMWDIYMQQYADCEPEILLDALQTELTRRIENTE